MNATGRRIPLLVRAVHRWVALPPRYSRIAASLSFALIMILTFVVLEPAKSAVCPAPPRLSSGQFDAPVDVVRDYNQCRGRVEQAYGWTNVALATIFTFFLASIVARRLSRYSRHAIHDPTLGPAADHARHHWITAWTLRLYSPIAATAIGFAAAYPIFANTSSIPLAAMLLLIAVFGLIVWKFLHDGRRAMREGLYTLGKAHAAASGRPRPSPAPASARPRHP